jgi:hypothetical protein
MYLQLSIATGFLAVASAAPRLTLTGTASQTALTAPSQSTETYSYPQKPSVNSAAVESAAYYAGIPASQIPGATNAVPPVVSSEGT